MKRYSLLAMLALCGLLGACARNKAEPPEEVAAPRQSLGTITLVPVESPKKLFTDNRGIPVVGFVWTGIANTIMDKTKSAEFDAKHGAYRGQIGERLTQAVQQELKARGFPVRMANQDQVRRDKDNVLNLEGFPDDEVVLDVQIDSFGMYSGRLSANYLPMVNTSIVLAKPRGKEPLLEAWYAYGAEADSTGDGYIQSDKRYAFPSFADLMAQPVLVVESFDEGIKKTAMHLAQDLSKQFLPRAQAVRPKSAVVSSPARISAALPAAARSPAKPGGTTQKRSSSVAVGAM
ncbi:MAG: hypothetical protein WBP72_09770 [Rhodocyclaceae bacterium]|jgi:hypothetical protein